MTTRKDEEKRKDDKSPERKKEERKTTQTPADYKALQNQLYTEKAIAWSRSAMVAKLVQYQKKYFGITIKMALAIRQYFDSLPLAYFVDLLVNPDLYSVHSLSCIFDLNRFPFVYMAKQLFSVFNLLDEDPRINGKLTSIFTKDTKLLRELIELLCMTHTHPSRGDILYLEETVTSELTRRSTLREEVVSGRNLDILLAIDLLIEYAEKVAASKSLSKLPALSTIMKEIWMIVDVDKDGSLDQEEARELTRLILSRPMLGKLMIAMVVDDESNSSWLAAEEAQAILPSLISEAVREMAVKAKSVARSLWEEMDEDLNGTIDEQEFCSLFPMSFLNGIAIPLSTQLAKLGKQRLSQGEQNQGEQTSLFGKGIALQHLWNSETTYRQKVDAEGMVDENLDDAVRKKLAMVDEKVRCRRKVDALENVEDFQDAVRGEEEQHHRNCVGSLGRCWDVREGETDKKSEWTRSSQRFADVSDLQELECEDMHSEWNDEERKDLFDKEEEFLRQGVPGERSPRLASEIVKDSSDEECKPGCSIM